ncbi:unnamed protein product [Effrenium voratum]|uniref:Uncharacterized protein n=1 Tax=Effrenium voratum TaxID=2562239 RepID=A0AA36HYI6_9DINO|nr:unnamed protein product [Effrenium voratum]
MWVTVTPLGFTIVYEEVPWKLLAERSGPAPPRKDDPDATAFIQELVNANLRALLDDDGSFQKYLQDQEDQAADWKGLQPAFGGVLDNQGNKLLTRLFTYVTVDGKIGTAQVVCTGLKTSLDPF